MPLYFLHLRDAHDELLDPDGAEYPTLEAAKLAVLRAARELIAAEALAGRVNLAQRIDAEDAHGQRLHSLRFDDAVSFVGAR